MNASLTIAFKEFFTKKRQTITLIFLVMFSTLLLSTGIGILFSINGPVKNMLKQTNASDSNLIVSNSHYDINKFEQWWKNKAEIKAIEKYKTISNSEMKLKKSSAIVNTLIVEKQIKSKQNNPIFIKGKELKTPRTNEVWIPTSLATAEKIELGDTLTITVHKNKKDLKVGAIIVDSYYSASMINPKRIWINETDFSHLSTDNMTSDYTFAIQYKNFEKDKNRIWKSFSDYIETPFMGQQVTIDTISYVYNIQFSLIGTILLLFSILTILAASYIIYFNISNAILTEYKQLGIYRVLGFSASNLRIVFLTQYGLIAIIAIPLGLIFSVFSIRLTSESLLTSIGIDNTSLALTQPFIISFILILLIIVLSILLSTKKIKKISPVQAIVFGRPIMKQRKIRKVNILTHKNNRLTLSLAMQNIISHARNSVSLVVSIAIVSFVFCFSINLANSLDSMIANRAYWGYNDADILLKIKNPQDKEKVSDILDYLDSNSSVKSIVSVNFYINIAALDEKDRTPEFMAMSFDGNLDSIGQKNIKGKNPSSPSEVSIGKTSAILMDKDIGDDLTIYINNKKTTLKITGIFQSVSNSGQGIRMSDKKIAEVDSNFYRTEYYIKTISGKVNQTIKEIKKDFSIDASVVNVETMVQKEVTPIVSGVKASVVFLSLIVLFVILLNIFSTIKVNIETTRSQLGIYKVIGMSTKEIVEINLWKLLILSLIGGFIGIVLTLLLSEPILSGLFSTMGITQFPFTASVGKTLIIIPICFLVLLLGAFSPLRKIKSINPKELITD